MQKLQEKIDQFLTGNKKSDQSELTSEVVDFILAASIHERASDIHIEPDETCTRVRLRIDGQLFQAFEIKSTYNIHVTNRIAIMCNMQTDAMMKKRSQDGRFSRKINATNFDFRVSTFPTILGEKMTIRVLYDDIGMYELAKIGLEEQDSKLINKLLQKKHGLILVSGPTGSGKTTTLYAVMNRLNSPRMNIITLENPVEYRMPGMNQCDINARQFGFAEGLRSILRQDPDVILVGEIRDKETADIAIRAAITGHLVFSTLHANSALGTVIRLMNMELEPFMISYALNGSIAQRLVRRICPQCKIEDNVDPKLLQHLHDEYGLSFGDGKEGVGQEGDFDAAQIQNIKFYKGTGCEHCNGTGYRGRVGIFEVVLFDDELREAILKRVSLRELTNIAIRQGYRTLGMDGVSKCKAGETTFEEIYTVLID